MKHLRSFLVIPLLAVIVGCSTFGIAPPKTFIDRAVAAQLSATAVRHSAATLLDAGAISVSDARNAQATADAANQAIDLATQFYVAACPLVPGNGATQKDCTAPAADAKLTSAIAILTVMQTYLTTKGAKP